MADFTTVQSNVAPSVTNITRLAAGKAPARLNAQQEAAVVSVYNGMQQPAVEDSYYTIGGGSVGTRLTGVVLGSATGTTYSATNAFLIIANTNAAGSGIDCVVDYVSIYVDTIAGGTPTFWHWYIALDAGNRYSSGTAAAITVLNASGASPSGISAYAGTLVATSASATVHDVEHLLMNNGASVANAKWTAKFGSQEVPAGLFTTPTTAVAQSTQYGAPIVVHPQYSVVFNELWAGRTTSALTGELTAGIIVR